MNKIRTQPLLCCILIMILMMASCSNPNLPEETSATPPPVLGDSLDETKEVTLTILTERFLWSQSPLGEEVKNKIGKNESLSQICDYYEHEHPNVHIELEILPPAHSTRETMIQRRRVELLAGKVPDIFLLPTMSCEMVYASKDYPLLFNDVRQAMTNNWFADISSYYEMDDGLQKDELQSAVMDAGVMDGKRYVLPFGYSMGLLVADREELGKTELADALQARGIQGYMEKCMDEGDLRWALERGDSLNWFLNFFPAVCNYQEETVLVQEDEVASAMWLYNNFWKQGMEHFSGKEIVVSSNMLDYLNGTDEFYINATTPVSFEPLERIIVPMGIAKAFEREIEILPLRASDGEIIADVTYWGAISPNCDNIDYAYDFLRTFLSEEVQHGEHLVTSDSNQYGTDFGTEVNPGWPVRTHGFLQKRWEDIKEKTGLAEGTKERELKLAEVQLDDKDLLVLDEEIDQVRFPSMLDRMINQTFSPMLYEDTSEEEISKLAAEFIRNMKYQLAES